MSEILGYDIDGKPLRAGDKALAIAGDARGEVAHVLRIDTNPTMGVQRAQRRHGGNILEIRIGERGLASALGCALRRIDDRADRKPSQESFEALMSRLKSGDIVSRPEGVVA